MFEVLVRVANPAGGPYHKRMMLVDSGAVHSALPHSLLQELGVSPDHEREFALADEELRQYPVGEARFGVGDMTMMRTAPVIFGSEGMYILGATTLQALELIPDTTNHQLVEAPALLIGIRGEPLDARQE